MSLHLLKKFKRAQIKRFPIETSKATIPAFSKEFESHIRLSALVAIKSGLSFSYSYSLLLLYDYLLRNFLLKGYNIIPICFMFKQKPNLKD